MNTLHIHAFLFLLQLSLIKCTDIFRKYGNCQWAGEKHDICRPDGTGIVTYMCDSKDKFTGDDMDKKQFIWQKEREVKCTDFFPDCRCFKNKYFETRCKCLNPTEPPEFPPTGVIRWNGTLYHDDNWWVDRKNPRITLLPGEVHKNKDGRYFSRKTKLLRWPFREGPAELIIEFVILIPNGDGKTFMKYTGNDTWLNMECTKEKVYAEEHLSSLWNKDVVRDKNFTLTSETIPQDGVTTQVWELTQTGDDWNKKWEWTMQYDNAKKYAVPVRYFYELQNKLGGENDREWSSFVYEPLSENVESFRLKDYCSNV